MVTVQFRYLTGLKRSIFSNARLAGTWDASGNYSSAWSETPMTAGTAEDGCPCFEASVAFDEGGIGKQFRWGVKLDGPSGTNLWGIPTQVNDRNSSDCHRVFQLAPDASSQDYQFTYSRRLGARKFFTAPDAAPGLRFSVWAPNALGIDVVFGLPDNGYIADDGDGIDPARQAIPLRRGAGNIWESPILPDFEAYEGAPYMYRILNAQRETVYRTDIFSRDQSGCGAFNPAGAHFAGTPDTLDGSKSCSVVTALDTVAQVFRQPGGSRVSEADFWKDEFTSGLPVPARLCDLIIYELHVNALGGPGKNGPGTLQDAVDLLPYLSDLGVNAVELLPMCEFSGGAGWGYGDSHHFVISSIAGTRDDFKYFVRECHRRGIAVLQDVCYNHFDFSALRDQWQYDSTAPEQNIFYWYEGAPAAYASPDGGYVDNGSTGYCPRFWEEMVRQLFVSSAASFFEEFHIDGMRVDLTQAIHRDNVLHADGGSVGAANQFGVKMLQEWSRTVRLIRPAAMLIAEDHTGWAAVTQSPDIGGLGFDSTWFASFYHNLIGDSDMAAGDARLIKMAGMGGDSPLAIEQFAGPLYDSRANRIVYHESHDEAGNAGGTQRTIVCAVGGAPLIGVTRDFAEARSRVAFGLSLLSAGTPMFFMGEEIGAQKPYTFDTFMRNREDLFGERAGNGARLFRFYQEVIKLSRSHPAARSQEIDIVHAIGANRVLAFTRSAGSNMLLVIASLANQPYLDGYVIQTDSSRLPDGSWREVFNSDAGIYGGKGIGNFGADIPVSGGRFQARLPAAGFLIFQKL